MLATGTCHQIVHTGHVTEAGNNLQANIQTSSSKSLSSEEGHVRKSAQACHAASLNLLQPTPKCTTIIMYHHNRYILISNDAGLATIGQAGHMILTDHTTSWPEAVRLTKNWTDVWTNTRAWQGNTKRCVIQLTDSRAYYTRPKPLNSQQAEQNSPDKAPIWHHQRCQCQHSAALSARMYKAALQKYRI